MGRVQEAWVRASPTATTTPRCAIVVMGVSGCGKSTLTRDLATQLGCPALEGDEFHGAANVAKMRAGQALTDQDRWPWLDRLGVAIAAAAGEGGSVVAACSALKRSYRERLATAAGASLRFVYLDGTRDEIAARLAGRTGHYMPASLLDSQFAALERPAPDEHALTLSCLLPVVELRADVLRWVSRAVAAEGTA